MQVPLLRGLLHASEGEGDGAGAGAVEVDEEHALPCAELQAARGHRHRLGVAEQHAEQVAVRVDRLLRPPLLHAPAPVVCSSAGGETVVFLLTG